jgi:sulfate/thiosulfate transport system permease protein
MPENAKRIKQEMNDPWWVRWTIIFLSIAFVALMLVLPLCVIFFEALRKGVSVYLASIQDRYAIRAIYMTCLAAFIAVPLNLVFGVAASWAIAKYDFRGKGLLIALIDLPFAISPVISGLVFILVFGVRGWLGTWLEAHGIQVIFAVPGIVLATIFVTFPFVARELIPLMQEQGSEEEWAAVSLGANGWQTFWRVTLPNIKWGVLYGVLLCNARAMGEFGAVSVVSTNVRGGTNTIPLHIESLYQDHKSVAAFAMASILASLGVITLIGKTLLERKLEQESNSSLESTTTEEIS